MSLSFLVKQGCFDNDVMATVNQNAAQLNMGQGISLPVGLLSASGAITVGPGTYIITKAGVAALTLAAPTAGAPIFNAQGVNTGGGQDGTLIVVTSSTANAHTITATGLLQTGSANVNVATFAAQAGASIELMAYNGKWYVLSSNQITFS